MSIKAPLVGRLGADPEIKALPNGTIVAEMSVATSGRRRNKQTDQWEDVNVTWWRVSAFADFAERLAANLTKGDPVIFYGEGYNRTYDTSDGRRGTSLEFKAEHGGIDWRWSDKAIRPSDPSQPTPRNADPWASTPPGGPDAPYGEFAPQAPRGVQYSTGASGAAGQGGQSAGDFSDEPPF